MVSSPHALGHVEGQEGLRRWEETVYIFLSEDFQSAFQQALQRGRQGERCYQEGRLWIEIQLAEIVTLDRLGTDQTEFEVSLGSQKPTEYLACEHVFDPDGALPPPMF
jgi:hypothetical protein